MGCIVNKENEIEVSILIVAFNHEKYICEAIDSVLKQKVNFKYEILLNDDCSTDHTQKIVKENYNKQVKMYLRKKNVGGTRSGYYLMNQAKGKYLIILEGDDYWIGTEKLQHLYDFMELNTNYAAVSQVLIKKDDHGRIIGFSGERKSYDIEARELLLGKSVFAISGCMFRNFFRLYPEKDFSIIYKADKHVGDLTIAMVLLEIGQLHNMGEIGSVYRVNQCKRHAYNYNSLFSEYEKSITDIKICKLLQIYFNKKFSFEERIINRGTMQLKVSLKNYKIEQVFGIIKIIGLKRTLGCIAYKKY